MFSKLWLTKCSPSVICWSCVLLNCICFLYIPRLSLIWRDMHDFHIYEVISDSDAMHDNIPPSTPASIDLAIDWGVSGHACRFRWKIETFLSWLAQILFAIDSGSYIWILSTLHISPMTATGTTIDQLSKRHVRWMEGSHNHRQIIFCKKEW